MPDVTRRQLLAAAGGGALGLAIGGSGGYALGQDADGGGKVNPQGTIAFHGAHQAGIVTPAQDRACVRGLRLDRLERAGAA